MLENAGCLKRFSQGVLDRCDPGGFRQKALRLRQKAKGRGLVERVRCPSGAHYFIKVMPGHTLRTRVRNRLRPARHVERVSRILSEASIPHSEPVAWGRLSSTDSQPSASFVATREVQGDRLDLWLADPKRSHEEIARVAGAMGRLFGQLYKHRVHHQDPASHNFILQWSDSDTPEAALIDLEGLYPVPIIPRSALLNRLRRHIEHSMKKLPAHLLGEDNPAMRQAFLTAFQQAAELKPEQLEPLAQLLEEFRPA
ncbi:hypothetical protein J2T60_001235 [Natronospira proteinivora]|uniref:Lipopolysaccharide kinase (Kdo/WaaP) family protein n=1 Tax=Natronospira proteinivora TaxID=1807133 RepID=A0ABT1G8N3_9GAMM|nr:lipopolysaccharide kinase InaA family protein [Natronospira proteinivora]MCP1727270.1 hypothetical protein [Natronospira proteinivora]